MSCHTRVIVGFRASGRDAQPKTYMYTRMVRLTPGNAECESNGPPVGAHAPTATTYF